MVGKFFKIILIALLILLVVFAVFADLPKGRVLLGHLDLAIYLKLVSLLGLLIALFVSIGYKRRVDVSQKYQRAKQVLEEAEEKSQRQDQALGEMEAALKARYHQKDQALSSQIREAQTGYETRLKALNEKNIELKESLAKTMAALKRERALRKP